MSPVRGRTIVRVGRREDRGVEPPLPPIEVVAVDPRPALVQAVEAKPVVVAPPPPVQEVVSNVDIGSVLQGITVASEKKPSKWSKVGEIALIVFLSALLSAGLLLGASYLLGCGGEVNQEIAQAQQACHAQPQPCKVTICHYPPGNPENVQTITVSCAALKTHEDHHADHRGECNCEQDGVGCPPPPACGDQSCNGEETCETCSADCGTCPVEPDASVPDSGSTEQDAGIPDAGVPDSGTIVPDSGTVQPDAAVVTPDSSVISPDSAVVVPDSGTIKPDSGTVVPPPPFQKQSYAVTGGCNVNPSTQITNNDWLNLCLMCFMLMGVVILYSMKKIWAAIIGIVLVAMFFTSFAWGFPTQNFKPAVGSSDYWVTEDTKLSLPDVSLTYDYEHQPLKLVNKTTGNDVGSLITDRHTLNLTAAYTIANAVQFGLDVPLVLGQYGSGFLGEVDRGGIGNIRLLAKALLWKWEHVGLGLGVDFGLPSSTVSYVDDNSFTFTPKLILSTSFSRVRAALNVGFPLQSDKDLSKANVQNIVSTSRFSASAAVDWNFYAGKSVGLDLVSDLYLSAPLREANSTNVPVEWINGIAAHLPFGFIPRVGVGVGLTEGQGAPDFRVVAGLNWVPEKKPCPKLEMKPVVINVVQLPPVEVPVPMPVPIIVPMFPPIYFALDKWDLDNTATNILDQVASYSKETNGTTEVELVGHTDVRASDEYNQKLSEKRVGAAKDYLVSKGVAAEKITTGAQGEKDNAVKDAKDEKSHSQNRRVTVQVSPFVVMPE